ncbi:zinc finger CCCH domain-containing protein 4-like [Mytilus californianus]|uniref:zinc finger CCCH domain-containing protein 4-like n=1 Tax=Mytilus californianus TaxID=6549 RepID=UPI0022474072|nr:zinc finger CCCH domain-containing protein 4-like [Mytilus californianus]
MVNEEVDIIFHCAECVRIPQDMEVEAVLEAPPSPAPASPPPATASPPPAPASPQPAPPSPPPASPQPLDDTLPDHSFDITLEVAEENPVVESDIEDPELSDSFVEDRPVTFEVVENGTMKRAKKLVSSDGFSYTVKV